MSTLDCASHVRKVESVSVSCSSPARCLCTSTGHVRVLVGVGFVSHRFSPCVYIYIGRASYCNTEKNQEKINKEEEKRARQGPFGYQFLCARAFVLFDVIDPVGEVPTKTPASYGLGFSPNRFGVCRRRAAPTVGWVTPMFRDKAEINVQSMFMV